MEIDINGDALNKISKELAKMPKQIKPAVCSAINRTLDSAVTQIKREVPEEYQVRKKRDIASALKKNRARSSTLSGSVSTTGKPLGVDKFKHTPLRPPPKQIYRRKVAGSILSGNGKKTWGRYKNLAFIQNKNDTDMVFVRMTKKRFPIKRLYSLSVPQMLADKQAKKPFTQKLTANLQKTLQKRVDAEINYRLNVLPNKAKGGQ